MKIHLTVTLVGPYILDNDGNIIGVKNFKINSAEIAKRMADLQLGKIPSELELILKDHKNDDIFVQNIPLYRALSSSGFNVINEYQDSIIDRFHKELPNQVMNMGLFKTQKDYFDFLRNTAIMITREKVKLAAEKRDRLIVHAIETIDDIDKTLNLFSGRLREFYGMHFPELVDAIDNHNTLAIIISETGKRENIDKKILVDELNLPEDKAQQILEARENSMGSTLLEQDMIIIQDQAKIIVDLYKRRQSLEKWMDEAMRAVAPNLCGVVSPLLGARLISLAGSLKDLALCASSKIQILGAEKALYRTIKTGAPPPKHGVIFQDSRLNQAKWWQRGKIARVMSGRLSIAARMDYFEAEDKSQDLDKELTAKIEEIKTKYPDPPEKPPKPIPRAAPSKRQDSYKKPQRSNYGKKKSDGSKKKN
ncbi:MAG: C/D box methylation guide ribonucleoprotein complex aNOP56 subunit [Asgard group archaeon]|nr:C/D box methylation guide ribonucleoprotein complex aNOP56 subunit [Asgard group archaeon]